MKNNPRLAGVERHSPVVLSTARRASCPEFCKVVPPCGSVRRSRKDAEQPNNCPTRLSSPRHCGRRKIGGDPVVVLFADGTATMCRIRRAVKVHAAAGYAKARFHVLGANAAARLPNLASNVTVRSGTPPSGTEPHARAQRPGRAPTSVDVSYMLAQTTGWGAGGAVFVSSAAVSARRTRGRATLDCRASSRTRSIPSHEPASKVARVLGAAAASADLGRGGGKSGGTMTAAAGATAPPTPNPIAGARAAARQRRPPHRDAEALQAGKSNRAHRALVTRPPGPQPESNISRCASTGATCPRLRMASALSCVRGPPPVSVDRLRRRAVR